MARKQVKLSEVLELFKNGYTRYEADAAETGQSIETHFELTKSEAKKLFNHDKIKRVKTIFQTMDIIDDLAAPAPTMDEVDDTATATPATPDLQTQLNNLVSQETPPVSLPTAEIAVPEEIDVFG